MSCSHVGEFRYITLDPLFLPAEQVTPFHSDNKNLHTAIQKFFLAETESTTEYIQGSKLHTLYEH